MPDEMTSAQKARYWRKINGDLRTAAQRILPAKDFGSFHECGKPAVAFGLNQWDMSVVLDPENKQAHLPEKTCKSPFVCPVCSPRVMRAKAAEVAQLIGNAFDLGFFPYLMTMTVQHKQGDPLKAQLNALSKAMSSTMRSRSVSALTKKHGLVGWVRAYDIVWSPETGWHPHFHNILFLRQCVDDEAAFKQTVFAEYKRQVGKLMRKRPSPKAFDFQRITVPDGESRGDVIAAYVAKLNIARYLTKDGKESGSSLYPFDLLRSRSPEHDALFREYAYATKGVPRIRTSGGLKAALGYEPPEKPEKPVRIVPASFWRFLKKNPAAQEDFLSYADNPDGAGYRKMLGLLQVADLDSWDREKTQHFLINLLYEFGEEPEEDGDEALAVEFEEL